MTCERKERAKRRKGKGRRRRRKEKQKERLEIKMLCIQSIADFMSSLQRKRHVDLKRHTNILLVTALACDQVGSTFEPVKRGVR
ncbi:hypothetical protein Naga_100015g78 [Nannochloropsis gaditana]|uniref:Uncharacterized protein n=1 Tax=Nannochloropsis gaditana TaxID=72520 RepID=W7TVP2_9STRA|nr:hypothetical protein Naga_100015g78 [Nannochloropsis gaditana]